MPHVLCVPSVSSVAFQNRPRRIRGTPLPLVEAERDLFGDVVLAGRLREAIRHVVDALGRMLVVQRTGWGKSFVYFIAGRLLREERMGPAVLISPLLALMRNQIAAVSPHFR